MKLLITGATGGMGEEIIKIFRKNSYEVIALGRDKKRLKKLEENYQVKSYSINIEEEIEIEKFLEDIEDEEIDVVINGAGIGEIDYFENMEYEKIKKLIEINSIALTKITHHFYKKMIERGNGKIINISSTAGFQEGGPLMSVYYGTKAYVNSLTLSLYEEGREKGVEIYLLTPGPTKTKFKGMDRELSKFEKIYVTTPEEVAIELWKGIERKKKIIIPGKINKILYFIDKFIPLEVKLKSIKKIQEKKIKNSFIFRKKWNNVFMKNFGGIYEKKNYSNNIITIFM